MPLSIPVYAALLQSKITSKSYQGHAYNGSMLPVFTLAVATGVINTATGLTGIIPGPSNSGTSSGIGIMFSGTAVATGIQSTAASLFGSEGPALQDFCDAVGEATEEHFALAALVSDANGMAQFPSFSAAMTAMASAIVAAAPSFQGPQWPNFALAIATGICQEIGSNGMGTLSGASLPPPGSGIVTIS